VSDQPKDPEHLVRENNSLREKNQALQKRLSASERDVQTYHEALEACPVSFCLCDMTQVLDQLSTVENQPANNSSLDLLPQLIGQIKLLDVNKATLQLVRCPDQETLKQLGLIPLCTDQTITAFQALIEALSQNNVLHHESETVIQTLDGEEIPIYARFYPAPGYEKSWQRVWICLHDRRTTQRPESLSHRTAQHLQRIIDSSSLGIVIVNSEGAPKRWSPTFERILNYNNFQLSALSLVDLTHLDDREQCQKGLIEIFSQTKDQTRFRSRCIQKGGTVVWIDLRIAAICDNQNQVIEAMCMVEDITQQIAIEEKLKQRDKELRQSQKMDAIGRLAGGVAHDFNNLLTGIQVSVHYLIRQVPKDSPLRDDVLEIDNCCKHGSKLTRRLLAFSRSHQEQKVVVDLNDIIRSMRTMMTRLIGENIRLETDLTEQLCTVKSDQNQLEQVLLNLAVNSRDALSSGGLLQIESTVLFLTEELAERFGVERTDPYVLVRVRDTGMGMSEEVVERLFEPFYTTKAPGKGTGLGLAVVYNIVQEHEGFIDVQSSLGQGTTFNIFFPYEPPENLKIKHKEESQRLRVMGQERILLVEDDSQVRRMLVRILEDSGYTVYEAADGEQAFAVAETLHGEFDLLLTDLILPKLNGDELFERIQRKFPNKKALFMSGYGVDLTDRLLKNHSSTNFIPKPLSPKQLHKKLFSIFKKKQ
jgi:two-component system, cell cycle sensor histidine kinase and response regulator CckA